MKLPNPQRAYIDVNKLAGYTLNVNHDDGKHKARVFKSALNITVDTPEELHSALIRAVADYDAVPDKSNPYGQKYIIETFQ